MLPTDHRGRPWVMGSLLVLASILAGAVAAIGGVRPNRIQHPGPVTNAEGRSRLRAGPLRMPYLVGGERGGEPFEFPNSQDWYLFIVVTEGDCYSGLVDAPFWFRVREAVGRDIEVVGVASGGPPLRLRYFLEQQGVAIPVVYDARGTLAGIVHDSGYLTPALLLVGADGAVERIDSGTYGSEQKQRDYLAGLGNMSGKSVSSSGRNARGSDGMAFRERTP